jgi:hypothetical protein
MKFTAADATESRQVGTDDTECSDKVMFGIEAILAPEQV